MFEQTIFKHNEVSWVVCHNNYFLTPGQKINLNGLES